VSVKDTVEAEIHRPDFGLRVIIVWKTVKGALLLAVGITAILLRHSDIHALGVELVEWLGIDSAGQRMTRWLDKLLSLDASTMVEVAAGAFAIAALMFVEAWGLHRRRKWAEWLTIIVTASLIPLEVYHLATHPSLGKVLTLVANVAIVVYLTRHHWLFRTDRGAASQRESRR
jgi:uncharacterized membrane protein (DUF2068 family)